ncbi:hypothetical protein Tsubulata_030227, partial [Turnera subulata]
LPLFFSFSSFPSPPAKHHRSPPNTSSSLFPRLLRPSSLCRDPLAIAAKHHRRRLHSFLPLTTTEVVAALDRAAACSSKQLTPPSEDPQQLRRRRRDQQPRPCLAPGLSRAASLCRAEEPHRRRRLDLLFRFCVDRICLVVFGFLLSEPSMDGCVCWVMTG